MPSFDFPGEVTVAPPTVPTFTASPPVSPSVSLVPVPGPAGPQGEPGLPGDSVVQHQHDQTVPAAVWGPIEHNLGRRPSAVSLFSADFAEQYGEYIVQHLDLNTLRISMDTPTAGVALIS